MSELSTQAKSIMKAWNLTDAEIAMLLPKVPSDIDYNHVIELARIFGKFGVGIVGEDGKPIDPDAFRAGILRTTMAQFDYQAPLSFIGGNPHKLKHVVDSIRLSMC